MQRAINRLGQPHIGRNRKEHVGRFYRDLIFVEIMVLQQLDMVKRAFDQRFGTRLAIFFEEVLFQGSGIYTNTDGAAIGLGRVDDLFHAL